MKLFVSAYHRIIRQAHKSNLRRRGGQDSHCTRTLVASSVKHITEGSIEDMILFYCHVHMKFVMIIKPNFNRFQIFERV